MERVDMIDWGAFDAVLFDLDGVLTATANVHARCWKCVFDVYLSGSFASGERAPMLFELPMDFTQYVYCKPRYVGFRSFL